MLSTGIGGEGKFLGLDDSFQEKADIFEEETRYLAQASDKILRKDGKGIFGKQFASHRLAEIMIDLFVMAATISRVQASIEANGAEAAAQEIDILRAFTRQAKVRLKHNFRRIDNNDDEIMKGLADAAFEAEGFSWDTI